MNIPAVNHNYFSNRQTPCPSADADIKIRALEQKLQGLETEKQKAAQRGDAEQEEKLERQIQEIEKQIQRLRKQENKEFPKVVSDASKLQEAAEKLLHSERCIDAYA